MYLYIDETETDDYFIVTGLLMPSQTKTDLAFKIFKNNIQNYSLPNKFKCRLYVEFKSTLLESKHRSIRKKMLETINDNSIKIICCIYSKETKRMKQGVKEKHYIRMVNAMADALRPNYISIVFDKFGIKLFDNLIVDSLYKHSNVTTVEGLDSRLNHGLQFVDNVCGIIRLHILKRDNNSDFDIIKNKIYYLKY